MNATALSSCAHVGLREVAVARRFPHRLGSPIRDRAALAQVISPTLYDPEEFAALFHADKPRAIALVAAMPEPLRLRQALAYAAWLDYHGLEIDVDTVLAAWSAE